MSGLTDETVFPIAECTKFFTIEPSAATIWRWCVHGVHGVKLEHIRAKGDRLYTSREAARRFEIARGEARSDALSRGRRRRHRPQTERLTDGQRRAIADLRAMGL